MAKAKVTDEKPEDEKAVATVNAFYDEMDEMKPEDSELGLGDVAVPRIKILHAQSPACSKAKPEYIPGAAPGMLCNVATERLWPGETGIIAIPCAAIRTYSQWRPRDTGEGFVADLTDHQDIEALWREAFGKRKENRGRILLPNGDELNRTMDHYVLVLTPEEVEAGAGFPEEAVIGFSGKQGQKSQRWLSLIQSRVLFRRDRTPFRPLPCAFSYKITTKEESNEKGAWAGFRIVAGRETLELPDGRAIYELAKSFRSLVLEGRRRATVEAEGREPGADADPSGDVDPRGDDGAPF